MCGTEEEFAAAGRYCHIFRFLKHGFVAGRRMAVSSVHSGDAAGRVAVRPGFQPAFRRARCREGLVGAWVGDFRPAIGVVGSGGVVGAGTEATVAASASCSTQGSQLVVPLLATAGNVPHHDV